MKETKKIPTMSIPLDQARGPYVLGIDVGSTASRGGLYDASGRPVKGSKQRIAHEFSTGIDGTSAIDADQVVDECREVIDGVVAFVKENKLEVSAVIMDSFASSLILVSRKGKALTRCVTYADSRCAPYVGTLREELDEQEYHARTGVRFHTSYHPARLAWLREEHPELLAKTDVVMTIGEYVYFQLAGIRGVATSTAAWSGIVNLRTGEPDVEILDAVGVDKHVIQPLFDPDEPAYPEATGWKRLNGLPWFHAIPDGWPSNIGPGAVDENTVAVAAATSGAMRVVLPEIPERVPAGLWCYRLSASSCIVGGALNDVGRAVAWLERTLAPVEREELAEALLAEPDDDTPFVLPFFSGERATGWAANARAAFARVSDDTSVLDMWRATVEGLALSYGRIAEELETLGVSADRVIASGRVTSEHPAWLQVLADTLRTPVVPLAMKRATLRGTALIALDVIDPGGERATPPFGDPYGPVAGREEHYRGIREEFDRLYGVLVEESR